MGCASLSNLTQLHLAKIQITAARTEHGGKTPQNFCKHYILHISLSYKEFLRYSILSVSESTTLSLARRLNFKHWYALK